ncbi:hypothetical protein [Streptomyces sp. ISL-86]|uniref:hypothetical protein n=1 Tax=Streptomyces sp. ISL-86 TaxID=2819187 RepID=UPI001BE67326|nr:hypothetical protein [Streptomyces sp. ISL-86]MBT2457966.1 hypothetical protein [Streptomyces sp. ISL-86]
MDSKDKDNPAAEVAVTISDCSKTDARTVIDLLEHFFPVAGTGRAVEGGIAATVWSTTLDAAKPPERRPAPVRVEDSVSVALQGSPRAVDRVQAALAGHFTVEGAGAVSGDQEKEIGLRIRSA